MLKEILSITGKPGLYKHISQGKNMLIVESLLDGKRMPAYAKDKAVSLADVAIFTEKEEVSLGEVLEKIKEKEAGKKASIDPKSDNDKLRKYLEEILPDYDKDRVYPSDIRKLLTWYNILIDNNLTDFKSSEETKTDEEKAEVKDEVKEKKKTAETTAKKAVTHQNAKPSQSKAASTVRANRSNRGV